MSGVHLKPGRSRRPWSLPVLPWSGLLLAAVFGLSAAPTTRAGAPSAETDAPVLVQYGQTSLKQFGLQAKDGKGRWKRLTYSAIGTTNVTLLKVDGESVVFGYNAGASKASSWDSPEEKLGPGRAKNRSGGARSVWNFGPLRVAQTLEIVRPARGGPFDICQATYDLENRGNEPLSVGVRVLLDTLLGDNDAPAFRPLPGSRLVLEHAGFGSGMKDKMPGALQFFEVADPGAPALTAFLSLQTEKNVEPPGRLLVTRMPEKGDQWEVKLQNVLDDGCAVMYWEERALLPGPRNSRNIGYAYGLRPFQESEAGSP